jgi:hypothetical protein
MGEIKSTWDIVLEKTKGMEITSGDRERIKREELTSKIHAIFHKYMDARGNRECLQREFEGLQVGEREVIERELLFELVDAVDLSKDNDKVMRGIEAVKGKTAAKVLEKLRLLASEFKASRDERARQIEEVFRRRFATRGISGSAVQPGLEGKEEWVEAMGELQRDYGNRLKALKGELLNS